MKLYIAFTMFVVLIGATFLGFYTMIDELSADAYGISINDSYKDRYGDLINYEDIQEEKDKIKEMTTDKEAAFFTGTWDAIKRGMSLIYNSFESAFTTVEFLGEDLNIPVPILYVIFSLMALFVIGAVLSMILKIN